MAKHETPTTEYRLIHYSTRINARLDVRELHSIDSLPQNIRHSQGKRPLKKIFAGGRNRASVENKHADDSDEWKISEIAKKSRDIINELGIPIMQRSGN